jgi:hypothetical protein
MTPRRPSNRTHATSASASWKTSWPGLRRCPRCEPWAERVQRRNAELESLAVENAALKRQIGLAHAGIDPESLLGQTVVTAAAADGIDDPAQVEALARTLRAELNGGPGRKESHGS